MWQINQTKVDERTVLNQIVDEGTPISFAQWASLINTSEEFVLFFIGFLRDSPFDDFFWEVKPVNHKSWNSAFEFALVKASPFVKQDDRPFESYFNNDDEVVSFRNIRKDALLVVPNRKYEMSCYGHLADFVRKGPDKQVKAFWKRVGVEFENCDKKDYVWLSTAGKGVAWLHVRLDSRPKYYRYIPYKTVS